MTRADSKLKFLDAALRVIRKKGYAATTIDDICFAAGLTKGSFFHHFRCKEDLALASATYFAAMASELFRNAPYQKCVDPRERVLGYIDFRAAILQGELWDFTCLLGTMVQETYDTHPFIRAACDLQINSHANEVAAEIADAKARYAPEATWTPESLGRFTQAVLQGAFVLAKCGGGAEVAAESVAHLRRYVEMLLPLEPQRRDGGAHAEPEVTELTSSGEPE